MVDSDSAFLWESEALRESPPRGTYDVVTRDDPDWLTLREANAVTGIPIPTLRKWARRDSVPSYLEQTPLGELRMVSLRGTYQRATELGREVKRQPTSRVEVTGTSPSAPQAPQAQAPAESPRPTVVDLDQMADDPEPPPGTMLVPLDAWNKVLMQLGNLHEAGQHLAEARERAAKAETEAFFLRERLAELRAQLAEARESAGPAPVAEPHPEVPAPPEPEDNGEELEVRDLGGEKAAPEPAEPEEEPEPVSFTTYTLEMVKHLYETWRGRPRR